jgi:YbbR domain-containing protein
MKRLIQEYILENWSLKTTAVLLAAILWLFVRGEPGPERIVPGVPLEVQVPRQMEVINKRPSNVEVTMRGSAFSDLWLSRTVPTTCVVDLSGAKEGEHVVTLTAENVRIPKGSGIEVIQVNPARVTLVLEATVSKEVPITIPILGEPLHGFEMYGRSSNPSSVILTGPRTRVNLIRDVSTEVISVKGQKQPVRAFVGLNIMDPSVRASTTNLVQVDIQIGTRLKQSTVPAVPLVIDDSSYVVSPRQVAIALMAPADASEELRPDNFQALVVTKNLDLSRLPARAVPRVSIVHNPSNIMTIKGVLPPEVTITKRKKK